MKRQTDTQIDRQTNMWTFRLIESIGPEGRCFENKEQGGSMLVFHEDLNPTLIKEYEESFELIVVKTKTEQKPIRVITGYGPEENWKEDERLALWIALKEEIATAELNGRSVILQMDANA